MKKRTNLLIYQLTIIGVSFMLVLALETNAQRYKISFAVTGSTVTMIDKVMVENLDQGTRLTLQGSDVLLLNVGDINTSGENVETVKVYPNPMQGLAELSFYAKETGYTQLFIYDMNGKVVANSQKFIEKGIHSYRIKELKDGLYVISIIGNNYTYSIKLVSQLNTESEAKLTYSGKESPRTDRPVVRGENGTMAMAFSIGDKLRFTAYAGDYISQKTDIPASSKIIPFEFTVTATDGSRSWTCGSPFTVNHVAGNVDPVNKTVDYGTVTSIPGEPTKCWITSNLGADYQASSINDDTEPSAGWYWQFNRKRGFKHDGHYRIPNTTWIPSINEGSDWRPENDPCTIDLPSGWRIPTITEWNNVERMWSDPWNSGLNLHHAGFLGTSDGDLYNRGSAGLYWSSNQEDNYHALYLDFDWGPEVYKNKPYGFPLRCIMENCTTSDAGPDQQVCDTATLAGNDPTPGTGQWTEESGASGYYFSNPYDNHSMFTGLAQTTYILRWTIYPDNDCEITYDDVNIEIAGYPTTANAGQDQTVTGTSTYLAGNTPTIGYGLWNIQSGNGGYITDPSNPASSFSGVSGTTYTLSWTIYNPPCDSSYDEVNITFQSNSSACPGVPSVTYEGQTYNTVQIGTQCWLKENLNVGTRVNGSQGQSNNGIIEKYCFNDDTAMCLIYGGLYLWDEMMQYDTMPGIQGICPAGWHVPTHSDWCTLTTFLDTLVDCSISGAWSGIDAGGKLKETGTTHWVSPNLGATNTSDFTALPGGIYYSSMYVGVSFMGHYWSSTLLPTHLGAQFLSLSYDHSNVLHYAFAQSNAISVRCVKD